MPIQTWYDLTYRPYDTTISATINSNQSLITTINGSYFGLFQPTARRANVSIWSLDSKTQVWEDSSASSYYGYLGGSSYIYMGSKMYFFRVGSEGLTLSSFDPATGTVSNHQTHALGFTTSSSDYPFGVIYCEERLGKVFYAFGRHRTNSSDTETIYVYQYDLSTEESSQLAEFSGANYFANSIGSDKTYLYLELVGPVHRGRKITISDGTVEEFTVNPAAISALGYNGFYLYSVGSTLTLVAPGGSPTWEVSTDLFSVANGGAVAVDDTSGYPYKAVVGYFKNVKGVKTHGLRLLSLNDDGSIIVHLNISDSSVNSAGDHRPMVAPLFGFPGGFRNQMVVSHRHASGFQLFYHRVSVE
jgi:hypothetical protein